MGSRISVANYVVDIVVTTISRDNIKVPIMFRSYSSLHRDPSKFFCDPKWGCEPLFYIRLDIHASHLYIKVLDFCKENGVILLSFPPHTSHRLQPLDVSVYGPFKKFYHEAKCGWLKSHPESTVSIYDIPIIVKVDCLMLPLQTISNQDFVPLVFGNSTEIFSKRKTFYASQSQIDRYPVTMRLWKCTMSQTKTKK